MYTGAELPIEGESPGEPEKIPDGEDDSEEEEVSDSPGNLVVVFLTSDSCLKQIINLYQKIPLLRNKVFLIASLSVGWIT